MLIMIKIVLKLSFSRKKMLNLLLKDLFLIIFLFFFFVTNYPWNIHYQQLPVVFDIGVFDKDLHHNVFRFQYLTIGYIVLVNNFLLFGQLLHYPIFLLPPDEFIANNEQTQVICTTSKYCGQILQCLNFLSYWTNFMKM